MIARLADDRNPFSAPATVIDAAMNLLDRGMQQNAAMAEETSAASLELLRGAEELNDQVSRFQRQDAATPATALGLAA